MKEELQTEQVIDELQIEQPLEQLIAARQRVAPEALTGDRQARKEFDRLNQEIRALESELQLAEVAEAERRRRAEEEETQRREAERREQESELKAAREDHKQKLRAVASHTAALVPLIDDAVSSGKRVYQLACNLGYAPRWDVRMRIAEEIKNTVGDQLPDLGSRLRIGERRSLVRESETLRRTPEPTSTITLLNDPDPSNPLIETVNGVVNGGKAA